ncbi:MAG: DUF4920 domain-containing protein [Bacteroidota bacterium]
MKKILSILSVVLLMTSCGGNSSEKQTGDTEKSTGSFGAKIDEVGAVPVTQLMTDLGDKSEMTAKVEGKITECCKKKGCWMDIDKGDGTTMKVTFKDYGFFVPKDAGGKTAIMQGRAFRDTTSVETLRHYAEDAGKSKEEIEKITEPQVDIAFEADGVIIK